MYIQEKNQKGFTLIEVLVAIVILSIGLIAFNVMQVQTVKGNSDGIMISSMAWLATDYVEGLTRENYGTVEGWDGNGTNPGVGGLDDGLPTVAGSPTSTTTPDRVVIVNQGAYQIRVNVAPDFPENNIITVRVIVVRTTDGKTVVTEYMKSNLG